MVVMVPQFMVTGVRVTKRQGEGVVSDMTMLEARIESRVSEGVHISFAGSYGKSFQHVKDNLTFYKDCK